MTQLQVFVKLKKLGNNVDITAITDSITINRIIPKSKVNSKEKLATWLLSQINTSTVEQDVNRQGILVFDYHIEQMDDGEGNLVDTPIIDGDINRLQLPRVLRRNLASSLNEISSISNLNEVKSALKELTKAVWFLNNS